MPKKGIRIKTSLFLFLVVVFSLAICGTASADTYIGGQPLTTVANGTVSGGVYSDSYYGFTGNATANSTNDIKTGNVTYNFKPLPSDAEIVSATLYTGVYLGNMQTDYTVDVDIDFNGKQLDSQHLSSSYQFLINGGDGLTQVNNHTIRVTSDYFMWYDVTDQLKQNNTVHVDTTKSAFDGRIKLITLIVVYNDGDSDKIAYWINQGQDVSSYLDEDYVGSTSFNGLPSGYTVSNATLKVIHMASTDGVYQFNGSHMSSSPSAGSYSGFNVWDITSQYKLGLDNTVTYHKGGGTGLGGYYKIAFAILTAKYTEPQTNLPELQVTDIACNPDSVKIAGKLFSDNSNTIKATIQNTGSAESGPFKVILKIGSYTETKTVQSLANGASTVISFTGFKPTTNDPVTINVTADSDKQVNEVNETNNLLSQSVNVITSKLPDLVPTNIEVPTNLEINKTYAISATIKNDGLLSSKATKVTLWAVDGSENKVKVQTADLKALDIGGTATLKFNWKPTTYSTFTLTISVDPDNSIKELDETNNEKKATAITKNPDVISVFMTSDPPGTNVLVSAAQEVLKLFPGKVDIQIRSGIQIAQMSESELLAYLSSCDIFIGDWVTTDAYNAMAPILKAHPDITEKKVFLMEEPPVSTVPASLDSMNLSVINGVKLLKDFNSDQLNDYYLNTMRGTSYNDVVKYLKTVNFPDQFNKGVLYKDLNNEVASKDEILWALSLVGLNTTYSEPPSFSNLAEYGIYRGKWYSYVDDDGTWHSGLEDYKKDYFKNGQPTVGLIESKMYVQAKELQPYDAIIAALEAKGINVIPVVAYGGTKEQLKVMLNTFTNATDIDAFLADPSKYKASVDAIVSMPAYGLGGNDFSKVSPFINALNVPIIRAVHSDYETNEQYELGTSGLRNLSGDKWWHIAILEAQGLIDPIFIGGMKNVIDPETGAVVIGYVPFDGNIKMLANTVNGWVQLKHTDNDDKKIAMIYYNYPPGKQNIAASYLDPVQSMLNLLNVLKEQGYDVENIPDSSTLLLYEMLAQGTNIANWAPGLVEKLANNNTSLLDEIKAYQETNTDKLDFSTLSAEQLQNLSEIPGVILYPVDDFMVWFNQLDDLTRLNMVEGPVAYIGELCKRAVELNYNEGMNDKIDSWYEQVYALLPEDKINTATPLLKNIVSTLKNYVNSQDSSVYNQYLTYKEQFLALEISGMSGWGEAPGDIMTIEKNGTKYFVLPGIQFGNVLIAPEPQRGWEGDPEQLYHNCVVPPHYQYLAFYAYLQQQGYDSMVFMGRHATHEWIPGKEILPAYNDFASLVTGGVPQVYFYIMDGVSEGLTAKRRGSAVIIDHLTPPMGFTQLYGGMSDLESLVEDYSGADATKKQEIITKMKKTIKDNNLEGDIGTQIDSLSDEKLVETIESYLNSVSNTFYPYGVDVIGQKWTDAQIALLVTSMLSVPFEIPGGGTETTSLQNEIAIITKEKTYDSLNAGDKNDVQNKCVDVVKELIHSDVATVANKLTNNPTNNLKLALQKAAQYADEINESVDNEVNNFINALNGGYIEPVPGNDPINNPEALPTGGNFYQDQAAEIPTKEAYRKAAELTLATLKAKEMTDATKKIVVGIWDTETARDNGELVSMILYLLGMEPQWTPSPSAGSGGQKLKEMPIYNELENLVRPDGWEKKRIDVVVVLDGNFRDLFSRQLGLMDKAFKVALARSYNTILADSTLKAKYGDKVQKSLDNILESVGYYGLGSESLDDNYVAYDWVQDFQYYMDKGIDYKEAGILAISRIFAPPENDYGADVSQAVRMSWTWENSSELAQNYLDRMGHIYSDTDWGTYNADAFTRALNGASNLFTSRNTNVYGILDNDDFFDYWGGLSMAMKQVNGETPNMYVLKYGNGAQTQAQTLDQFMNRELNSRYYNPDWIQGMMDNGYAGAGYMQKFVANMWGWQVTRPESVQNWMWDSVVDVYLNDKYNMGVTQFMESGNNAYAMTSMTGTMLTAAYEGYWKTDDATLSKVANEWAKMVIKNGVACCDCSCGNIAMMKWATTYINPDILAQFKSQLYTATQNEGFAPSSTSDPNQGGQSGNSGQDNGQGQSSSGTSPGEQVSAATTPGESGEQGKAHEINKVGEQSSSQTGMPIAATVGVIALVCLIALGYFRGRSQM